MLHYFNVGDVVFSSAESRIYIYFSPLKLEPDNLVIPIGITQIDAVAIGRMKTGDPIRIMSISPDEKTMQAPKTDFPANRKLTQSEIDDLVQQLLNKKKDNQ